MATTSELPKTTGRGAVSHTYHAEAHALSGKLERPIEQEIEHQAKLTLNDLQGGHFTRQVERTSLHGLVSFAQAYTRISGSRSRKHNGWVTVSTSIVETLNVFEVIHADRLVSQVSTDHPYQNGHVPQVTFLGTQFDNLRVSGFPLKLQIDLGVCGTRPENGRSYLDDKDFLETVKQQTEKIAQGRELPKELKTQYDERLAEIDGLISAAGRGKSKQQGRKIICSVVESIGEIPIPGVKLFGNLLLIPEFGTVTLGELEIGEKMYQTSTRPSVYFELTSIKMKLGCVGDGTVQAAATRANGAHHP